MATNSRDNPDANCLPIGFMQLHTHSQPRKMVQTRDDLVIMYEANYGLRQIFTDGRPLPAGDPQPWWFGYSVGTWDGDTLVVETTNFSDRTSFRGSDTHLRLVERFRRVDAKTLDYQFTVDDASVFSRPWTASLPMTTSDGPIYEYACHEGNYAMTGILRGARAQEQEK
jgi:hypothetical protein